MSRLFQCRGRKERERNAAPAEAKEATPRPKDAFKSPLTASLARSSAEE